MAQASGDPPLHQAASLLAIEGDGLPAGHNADFDFPPHSATLGRALVRTERSHHAIRPHQHGQAFQLVAHVFQCHFCSAGQSIQLGLQAIHGSLSCLLHPIPDATRTHLHTRQQAQQGGRDFKGHKDRQTTGHAFQVGAGPLVRTQPPLLVQGGYLALFTSGWTAFHLSLPFDNAHDCHQLAFELAFALQPVAAAFAMQVWTRFLDPLQNDRFNHSHCYQSAQLQSLPYQDG